MVCKTEPRKPSLILFLLCVGVIPAQFIPHASAQPQDLKVYKFDVEPSLMAQALHRFAEDSGLQVFYEQHVVRGRRSAGVVGHYTARRALDRLLAQTGLTYYFVTPRTVIVIFLDDANDPDTEPSRHDGGDPFDEQLEQIVVWAEGSGPEHGFLAVNASTASKTDALLVGSPWSIHVVPLTVIEAQSAFEFSDVLRNFSGVVSRNNPAETSNSEDVFIRGFRATGVYRNSVLDRAGGKIDLANVDRVEVLKGPASSLYGFASAGGVVNYITKKPTDSPHYQVEQRLGSHDFYRTTVDMGGPIDAEKELLYRLNLSYTTSNSFRDFVDLERFFAAPSFTWRIDDQTHITFDGSFLRDRTPFDGGVAFGTNGKPVAPIKTFLGEPSVDGTYTHEAFAGYTLHHQPSPGRLIRHSFSAQWQRRELSAVRLGAVNPGNLASRFIDDDSVDHMAFQGALDGVWTIDTPETSHELLVGVELHYDRSRSDRTRDTLANTIDIINPVLGNLGPIASSTTSRTRQSTTWVALYGQDQISLLEDQRLKVIAGGRLDYVESHIDLKENATRVDRTAFDLQATGRLGVLYELDDHVTGYCNITQSFQPQSPLMANAGGSVIDPEQGLQLECGIKLLLLEDRLYATIAGYQITKDNIAVDDRSNPGSKRNGGRQRSRGVEFDVVGRIAPGLSVTANYAYTDTEILSSDIFPRGARFAEVPLHNGGVWVEYRFPSGTALDGLGGGVGLFAASGRDISAGSSTKLDGYATVNLGLWYERTLDTGQRVKAAIHVKNAFDKEYYIGGNSIHAVQPAPPASIIASVNLDF